MSINNHSTIQLQDIHSSWIKSIPNGVLLEKLRQNANVASSSLMNIIQQHISIKHVDMNSEKGILKDIYLRTPSELQEIVLKAGAAQLSSKFSQIINQYDVKKIKMSLGEDLYKFSLYEVPVIFPKLALSRRSIITTNLTPLVHVIDAGYNSLCIALGDTPSNCMLKLPKQWWVESFKKNNQEADASQRSLHVDLILNLIQIQMTTPERSVMTY